MTRTIPLGENRVLAWMCVIIAVNQLGFGALIPVLPLYAQSFGVTTSAIGSTIAIYGLARFVLAIPAGRLADRLGRRPTMAIGGMVSAIGNLGCALAQNFPEFLVARFIAGAGAGLVITVGVVVLADISPPHRRGRMMATYQSVFLFAVGVGPFPGGMLAEHLGLAAPFVTYAALAAVVGTMAWFAIPETRDFATERRGEAPHAHLPYLQQLGKLFSNTGFLLVSLISFMNAVARTGGLFAVVPLIAAGRLGLSVGQIGSGFALGSVIGMMAAYPAGVLADRHGRKPVIVPSTILTGLSMAAFSFAPDFTWFVIGCLVWGASAAVSGAAPSAYAADSAPPGMNAAAMSTFRMLADVGYVVGPIGLGLLADLQGPVFTLCLTGSLTVVAGLLFARFAQESHRA